MNPISIQYVSQVTRFLDSILTFWEKAAAWARFGQVSAPEPINTVEEWDIRSCINMVVSTVTLWIKVCNSKVQDRVTLPRKVELESWANQTMAACSLRINKGKEKSSENRHYTTKFYIPHYLNQFYWIEMSAMMEMFYVCAVQYSSHQPHATI